MDLSLPGAAADPHVPARASEGTPVPPAEVPHQEAAATPAMPTLLVTEAGDPADAVAKVVLQHGSDAQRQAALADTTGASERDQSRGSGERQASRAIKMPIARRWPT